MILLFVEREQILDNCMLKSCLCNAKFLGVGKGITYCGVTWFCWMQYSCWHDIILLCATDVHTYFFNVDLTDLF